MKSEVYARKTDTPDELLAAILDAAARIEKREDLLRRTTRDLFTRVAIAHRGLRWDIRRFVLDCNIFLISL